MVLINVPPILRPNSQSGMLYFTFEMTYMIEIECFYESLQHPQKVPVMNKYCTVAAVGQDIHYNQSLIVPPNHHFHGQVSKGLVHGRTNKVFADVDRRLAVRVKCGKFLNK